MSENFKLPPTYFDPPDPEDPPEFRVGDPVYYEYDDGSGASAIVAQTDCNDVDGKNVVAVIFRSNYQILFVDPGRLREDRRVKDRRSNR